MPALRQAWSMFKPASRSAWTRGGSRRSGPVWVVFAWVAPWLSASCTIPIKTGPGFGGQARGNGDAASLTGGETGTQLV